MRQGRPGCKPRNSARGLPRRGICLLRPRCAAVPKRSSGTSRRQVRRCRGRRNIGLSRSAASAHVSRGWAAKGCDGGHVRTLLVGLRRQLRRSLPGGVLDGGVGAGDKEAANDLGVVLLHGCVQREAGAEEALLLRGDVGEAVLLEPGVGLGGVCRLLLQLAELALRARSLLRAALLQLALLALALLGGRRLLRAALLLGDAPGLRLLRGAPLLLGLLGQPLACRRGLGLRLQARLLLLRRLQLRRHLLLLAHHRHVHPHRVAGGVGGRAGLAPSHRV
mmetsp:Transcript_71220/g.183611  ORF Transcript_71220/g.183611 Transcript_71220/m.183611 type:complete len:278 (-) Transcript_71220:85-918(-)